MAKGKRKTANAVPGLFVRFMAAGSQVEDLGIAEIRHDQLARMRDGRHLLSVHLRVEAPEVLAGEFLIDALQLVRDGKIIGACELPSAISVGGPIRAAFAANTLAFG